MGFGPREESTWAWPHLGFPSGAPGKASPFLPIRPTCPQVELMSFQLLLIRWSKVRKA